MLRNPVPASFSTTGGRHFKHALPFYLTLILTLSACGGGGGGTSTTSSDNSVIPNDSPDTTTLADTTPPAPVGSFAASLGATGNVLNLSWTNPADSDFAGVVVVRSSSGTPASLADGTTLYSGTGTTYSDTGLTNGTTYYYSVFSYDGIPNYSAGTSANATPVDPLPTLQYMPGDISVTELDAEAIFTVFLSEVTTKTVTFDYYTSPVTATDGEDYTHTTGTVIITPGSVTATVTIPILDDNLDENDIEEFSLHIVNAANATIPVETNNGSISDNNNPPGVNLDSFSFIANERDGDFTVPVVRLSSQSGLDVTVGYILYGNAVTPDDYINTQSGVITIPAYSTLGSIVLTMVDDDLIEDDENINIRFVDQPVNAFFNFDITNFEAVVTLTDNDFVLGMPGVVLNDTGLLTCADDLTSGLACPVATHPGQDAEFGRDVTLNFDADGRAGFSFTKLDANGNILPSTATSWECVKDEVTGLIWQKGNSGQATWYQPNPLINGGIPGTPGATTLEYANSINATGLCGHNDWRLPTRDEWLSIIDYGSSSYKIDTNYFPYIDPAYEFWTSETLAFDAIYANTVALSGSVRPLPKTSSAYVRLVRSDSSVLSFGTHPCNPVFDIPASTPTSRFIDNNDGVVIDTKTDLMWFKCAIGQTYNVTTNSCDGIKSTHYWLESFSAITSLNGTTGFGGYADWRLPNIKEIMSLIESQCFPAINNDLFPNAIDNQVTNSYWSSTNAITSETAFTADFFSASALGAGKAVGNKHYVRPVRYY